MFNTSFGHGDVLLWFFEIFLFVVWFWLLMDIFADLFRDHETSGVGKALWVVFLVLFPYVGVLGSPIFRGGGMNARAAKSMRETQERIDAYVRSVAGRADPEGEGPVVAGPTRVAREPAGQTWSAAVGLVLASVLAAVAEGPLEGPV